MNELVAEFALNIVASLLHLNSTLILPPTVQHSDPVSLFHCCSCELFIEEVSSDEQIRVPSSMIEQTTIIPLRKIITPILIK